MDEDNYEPMRDEKEHQLATPMDLIFNKYDLRDYS